MATNASYANASNVPIAPPPTPAPAPAPASSSPGSYKGVAIQAGSDADVAAQVAKINATQSGAHVIPVSALTGGTSSPIVPAPIAPPSPVPTIPVLTETPAEKQQSDVVSALKDLNTQEAGKSAFQTEQNTAAGVDHITQAINDNAVAIKQLNNDATSASLRQDNRQAPEFAISGAQAQIERNRAVQALTLSSISDVLSNNLVAAKAKADQAVTAKYGPIESQIEAYTKNLTLIQNDPATSLQDKNRATAAQVQLQAYSDSIAKEKADHTSILQTAQSAATKAPNFVPSTKYPTLASALNAVATASTPLQATEIATEAGLVDSGNKNQIIGSAATGYFNVVTDTNGKVISSTPVSGGGAGVPTTFSSTQLNNGAANAGIAMTDFGKLTPDDKNYFINGYGGFTAALKQVQAGNATLDDLKAAIDEAPISESAKQILYKKGGITASAATESGSGGWFSNAWNAISGFFGG